MRSRHVTDPLSPERMETFLSGLTGLAPEEIRKAKVLYVRNAISEHHALVDSLQAFGCLQLLFAIIPLFWPMLYVQRRMMLAQRRLSEERIRNALDVWRDDLRGESFDLPFY